MYSRPRYKEPVRGQGLQPLDVIEGYQVRPGFYKTKGATPGNGGVSFTVGSHHATKCTLLLFRPHEKEPYARIPFPDTYRIGSVYSMFVYGLKIEDFEYAFQFDGPYDERAGHRFNKDAIILDPYARAVTEQRVWGEKFEDGYVYKARVVENNFDWGKKKQLENNLEDLVIYEMHVRGFTMDPSSGVKARGTFEGIREKIPYLKELGVNAVELMPIFEFDEMGSAREHDGKKLLDYWGYNTVCYYAPNTSYSYRQEHNHEGDELKSLIRELHDNGIEVLLDVVFNHTAEGNELGPTFSFKGIDNKIYYMLTPEGYYYNFSGCGNTVNCNHPVVRRFIIDCLRYWVVEYRVDGFRFDLASILSRDKNGAPMDNPPLLENMAFDETLSGVKLIAEAWDAGGLYQVGTFPSWNRWAEWNGRYRDDMRRFLKSDPGMAPAAVARMTGSRDIYDPLVRGQSASVNFLTCHDGFTLYDLYSYNMKHNEANGWDNTDGDNNGNSWNCGVEGETDDPAIEALRRRMVKNAFAVLLCSRGPAMFYAGDEFCNTQKGNNNAYCQDNEISWLDWRRMEEYRDVYEFARFMIAFRKEHPVLRKPMAPAGCGFADISYHHGRAWNADCGNNARLIGLVYAGKDDMGEDDLVYVGVNTYWETLGTSFPDVPEGYRWMLIVDTGRGGKLETEEPILVGRYDMAPRSVIVMVVKRIEQERPEEPQETAAAGETEEVPDEV
ncbi:alpha-amylase family glycosyl hydrolase [Lachnospiraceae bacterium 47-T17]